MVSLIAPTSENRIEMIAKEAEGFIYCVSSLGVTGMRSEIKTDIKSIVETVRKYTDIPVAVGFGISTPAQAEAMARVSDGAIVGSAIVKIVAEHGENADQALFDYVQSMKQAVQKSWRIKELPYIIEATSKNRTYHYDRPYSYMQSIMHAIM